MTGLSCRGVKNVQPSQALVRLSSTLRDEVLRIMGTPAAALRENGRNGAAVKELAAFNPRALSDAQFDVVLRVGGWFAQASLLVVEILLSDSKVPAFEMAASRF
jgi:hypothetical protein